MFFWLLLAFTLPLAFAQYGASVDTSYDQQPSNNYNSPVVVPQPILVPVAPPPQLPELEASHEILRPRKHHDSHSGEWGKRCKNNCRDIKTSCKDEDNCKKPKIKYLSCKGCGRAIVSCPGISPLALKTIDGEVLTFGVGVEKVVKCGKHRKWSAEDVDGEKIKFKHLICVEPIDG